MNLCKIVTRKMIVLLLFALVFSVGACIDPNANNIAEVLTNITMTPVPPSPSPTPTCPSNVTFSTPEGWEPTPTYIVVLIDQTIIRGEVLQYADGRRTSDTLGFFAEVLPRVIDPGDGYSLFRLNVRSYESARITRGGSSLNEAPQFPPTPEPQYTLTPIGTLTPNAQGVLAQDNEKREYTTSVAAHHIVETKIAHLDNCIRQSYKDTFQDTVDAWHATQTTEAGRIATSIHQTAEAYLDYVNALETPFASNVIYEGLSHVTLDFEGNCGSYARCILIILDDLDAWQITRPPPQNLYINLTGVEIIVIMAHCLETIQPSCQKVIDHWTQEFDAYGALEEDLQFISAVGLEQFLIEYLEGAN